MQTDGTQYFHACPPLAVHELRAAIDDGSLELSLVDADRLDAAQLADAEGPPPENEPSHVDAMLRSLVVERPNKRDENIRPGPAPKEGAARIKAEGDGVVELPADTRTRIIDARRPFEGLGSRSRPFAIRTPTLGPRDTPGSPERRWRHQNTIAGLEQGWGASVSLIAPFVDRTLEPDYNRDVVPAFAGIDLFDTPGENAAFAAIAGAADVALSDVSQQLVDLPGAGEPVPGGPPPPPDPDPGELPGQ
jgi:hypothetical protein